MLIPVTVNFGQASGINSSKIEMIVNSGHTTIPVPDLLNDDHIISVLFICLPFTYSFFGNEHLRKISVERKLYRRNEGVCKHLFHQLVIYLWNIFLHFVCNFWPTDCDPSFTLLRTDKVIRTFNVCLLWRV